MLILLIIGISMLVALIFTKITEFFKLPNVTAYLIAGVVCGPYVLNIIKTSDLSNLSVISSFALGFIAFSIGAEFKLEHIKALGKKVLIITAFQALTATFLVDLVLIILGFPKAEAITLGAIATATAPAATILVVRQYKAKGELTSTLLPVVAMDDALGLIVFAVSISIAQLFNDNTPFSIMSTIVYPLIEILMSLLIGAIFGVVLTLLHNVFKIQSNRLCITIAFIMIGVFVAKKYQLSDLLVCMSFSAVFVNLRSDFDKLLNTIDSWTPPIFMMFFVVSGAELKLDVLFTVGALGFTYIIVRSIGKYLGAYVGSLVVNASSNVRNYLGITLLPQAGVAIGMAQLTLTKFPSIGDKIQAVVLCSTLVYELFGPFATKIALMKAGDIKPENA